MRIIAGRWRGKRLIAVPGMDTRPTADRVRQALFDTLAHGSLWRDVFGPTVRPFAVPVLDAFAGTGALGLEALSRGASQAFFIERDRRALGVLYRNVENCVPDESTAVILPSDVRRPPPAPAPCGLLFLDPPYGKDLVAPALTALQRAGWIGSPALAVIETNAEESLPALPGFAAVDTRSHGRTTVHILRSL